MELRGQDNHRLFLRNKFFNCFEDFEKEIKLILQSKDLKLIENLDLNRNYLTEYHLSMILSMNVFDYSRIKIINL